MARGLHIQADVAEIAFTEDWSELSFRLFLALLAGGLIGWNRERENKPAGLRTHMLISLGSALFVMTAARVSASPESASRVIQGIAAGIGFLGAGEIVVRRRHDGNEEPMNLTSAAAIWVAAGIGIAAGCGLWELTLSASAVTLITLGGLKRIDRIAARPSEQGEAPSPRSEAVQGESRAARHSG